MMTITKILILFAFTIGINFLLKVVDDCQKSLCNTKLKILFSLVISICFIIMALALIYIHAKAGYDWHNLLGSKSLHTSILLAAFGTMAGYLYRNLSKKMETVWKEPPPHTDIYPVHIIYIGFEIIFITIIGIGAYGLINSNTTLKTPYFSIDFRDKNIAEIIKPPRFDIKRETNEAYAWLDSFSIGIPCAVEGDLAFYKLINDAEAITSIEASRPIIYQLSMLLDRARDAHNAGEPRQRIADKMSHVKAALYKLLALKPENKNDLDKLHEIINELNIDLKTARTALQEVSDKGPKKYSLPQPYMKDSDWCTRILDNHNGEEQKNNGFIHGRITEIEEGVLSVSDLKNWLYKLKSMPHIYLIAATIIWYDSDLHMAIKLLENAVNEEENANNYIRNSPNIYNTLHMLALSDHRPDKYIFEYSNKFLESLKKNLKIVKSNTKSPDKDALIERFETRIFSVKNDFAYELIRQQKPLSFEEIKESLDYAADAFNYDKSSSHMDTLGYVHLVAALRGYYDDDIDNKKHEIHRANLLISGAYDAAMEEYNSHYIKDDEDLYYTRLMLIEEHLKDAKKYSTELDM